MIEGELGMLMLLFFFVNVIIEELVEFGKEEDEGVIGEDG